MTKRPHAAFASGSGSELAEFALASSTSTRCHVIVEITSHLNQRWARNSLTTNGSTLDITVTAIAFDERADGIATASVSESVSDLEAVIGTVHAADAAALLASPAEDAAPFPAPAFDEGFDDASVTLSPSTLTLPTAYLGQLIAWARTSDIELFGYLEREFTTTWLATSDGARRRYCAPVNRLEITAKSHGRTRSTWHGFAAVDLDDAEWHRLRADIRQELDWQATSIAIEPGRHTALLSPSAIGDFVIDMYWSAGARDAAEGRSAFHDEKASSGTRIGQFVAGRGINVSSNPHDLDVPASPFALTPASGRMASVFDNGRTLNCTDWIDAGRLEALIATGSDAERFGIGHAPVIDSVRLDVESAVAGTATQRDLMSGLDDGLMVTCVWYNRTVDPQTMLLTGLTRDGVYVVRGGEVIGAASNFRFNDSPISMLNRIIRATEARRTLPREMADYANNVAMPAVVIDAMNFTSVSDAR